MTPRARHPLARRRALMLGAAAGCAGLLGEARAAEAFPNRPVVLVAPFPPGGGVDAMSRAVAERLSPLLGVPVLVDNRAGGSTSVASAFVARAAADGHVLLLGTPALSINPVLQPSLPPGDPRQALAPIVRLAALPYVLVGAPNLPARNLGELVAWARANPGALTIANSGAVTAPRLATELFAWRAGVQVTHVPYRGGGPAAPDILAGRVMGSVSQSIEALPLLERGARALAVTTRERSPILPEVPAMAELFPGFDVPSWNGFFAPAGTPEPVLDRLNAAFNTAIRDEGLRAHFRAQGVEFVGGARQELAALLDREIRGWTELRDTIGITPE